MKLKYCILSLFILTITSIVVISCDDDATEYYCSTNLDVRFVPFIPSTTVFVCEDNTLMCGAQKTEGLSKKNYVVKIYADGTADSVLYAFPGDDRGGSKTGNFVVNNFGQLFIYNFDFNNNYEIIRFDRGDISKYSTMAFSVPEEMVNVGTNPPNAPLNDGGYAFLLHKDNNNGYPNYFGGRDSYGWYDYNDDSDYDDSDYDDDSDYYDDDSDYDDDNYYDCDNNNDDSDVDNGIEWYIYKLDANGNQCEPIRIDYRGSLFTNSMYAVGDNLMVQYSGFANESVYSFYTLDGRFINEFTIPGYGVTYVIILNQHLYLFTHSYDENSSVFTLYSLDNEGNLLQKSQPFYFTYYSNMTEVDGRLYISGYNEKSMHSSGHANACEGLVLSIDKDNFDDIDSVKMSYDLIPYAVFADDKEGYNVFASRRFYYSDEMIRNSSNYNIYIYHVDNIHNLQISDQQ